MIACFDRLGGGGAKKRDRAFVGANEPEHHVDGGGLPRAVGAEQGQRLARVDREIDAANGLDVAVGLGEICQSNAGAFAGRHLDYFR